MKNCCKDEAHKGRLKVCRFQTAFKSRGGCMASVMPDGYVFDSNRHERLLCR
ncbi:hypothetical protein NEIELOOT_00318 [Neisseria elongata subsp. glycolytica ATCC 29315]|uniref:Uncharacterized protein n=1 Tax=Neisseria elongata subsp. glycolytica ATCC 29315 TaxID=546263 RepID=D4DMP4_NEIEG|nr:hypothetical protein NEIELOOT_00318 [Neisseria elongata subsp. glycolytica ATCC 29315]